MKTEYFQWGLQLWAEKVLEWQGLGVMGTFQHGKILLGWYLHWVWKEEEWRIQDWSKEDENIFAKTLNEFRHNNGIWLFAGCHEWSGENSIGMAKRRGENSLWRQGHLALIWHLFPIFFERDQNLKVGLCHFGMNQEIGVLGGVLGKTCCRLASLFWRWWGGLH